MGNKFSVKIYSPVAPRQKDWRVRHDVWRKLAIMHTVYVLKSKRNSKQYIGFTSKDVKKRLIEHNFGSNRYTKNNRPFELIYFEEYPDKNFALKREKFLKTGRGRKALKIKLSSKT